jgi:UDP-N-acetylglucosamine 2-epimerase (non-hydrolysing)
MKIMTIFGTRPEIIKLSRLIAEIERHFKHVLVHTGQNYDYELNELFFQNLAVRKPDHFLNVSEGSVAQTIANVIARTDEVMEKEKPDAVLLYGDTNSSLAVISAKRRKIPVFHCEAGNRCFDQRVPEELNRKIVDHLSDVNLPQSEHARRNLLAEGLRTETIIKTGSPMKEVLTYHLNEIEGSDILKKLNLARGGYFLVSTHREENIDSDRNFGDLLNSLNAIAEHFAFPVIVSTHPRTRKRLESFNRTEMNSLVQFLKPMGFFDYVKLQRESHCVISDSGTITEESSILNFPAITIRQAQERPEGMDEGVLIMSGLKRDLVLKSIDIVTSQFNTEHRNFRLVTDYDVDNFSQKVLRIIMSYTDYINRTVWKKFL